MSRITIFISALLPMMFWGVSFVWSKIVFRVYGPVTTITLRLIIGTILLSGFIFLTGRREKIQPGDLKYFIMVAFLEPFCYFIGESLGLKLVSPTLAAVTISTIPVVTPVFAFFILRERLTATNVAGLFLSFFGVLIMVMDHHFSLTASPTGLLLLGFAVLSAVGYGMVIKQISGKYSSLTIVNLQNMFGILFFLPVFFLSEFKSFANARPGADTLWALLGLAVLCSTVAFILMTVAIREIGVSRFNAYTNTIPAFTAVFAWLILGEAMDSRKLIGMTIVLGGLYLSQLTRKTPIQKEILFAEG